MAALGDQNLLGAELQGFVVYVFNLLSRQSAIPDKHGQIGAIPSEARERPAFLSRSKDNSSIGNVLGVINGFPRIYGIHIFNIRFIDGDFNIPEFILGFLFHPITGINQLFNGQPHVIAGIATVFRKFKKAFGPDTLGVTNVSGN